MPRRRLGELMKTLVVTDTMEGALYTSNALGRLGLTAGIASEQLCPKLEIAIVVSTECDFIVHQVQLVFTHVDPGRRVSLETTDEGILDNCGPQRRLVALDFERISSSITFAAARTCSS